MDYMRRSSSLRENLPLAYGVAAIVILWTALFLWERLRRNNSRRPQPKLSVFDQLCAIHELSPGDRRLLVQAASECQLDRIERLFVERGLLERLARGESEQAGAFEGLSQKLFGN